jgi:flagellar basal-body rod protein FlgF
MDSGLYVAGSGLVARLRALDIAAQDLSNLNTTAYRGTRASFQSLLAKHNEYGTSVSARAINQHSVIDATEIDLAQGQITETGNPLDVAIEGTGFLEVETTSGIRYTRNGSLRVSLDGLLLTFDGHTVSGESGPITLPTGTIAIGADGTISVNGAVAGKLKIVQFDAPSQLVRQANSLFSAPAVAARASQSKIRQGMLEGANVNAVEATVGLITLQRHAEMLQRAMSAFHSEFNRAAVEELPRI